MTTIERTHEYSCLLDSFSFITGLSVTEFIYEIGHGGSGNNEPKGFHTQEIIDPLVKRGFWLTPIELFPVAQDPETQEQRIVRFGTEEESNFYRFAQYLHGSNGVLIGFNQKRLPHATAWTQDLVHDPNGIAYPILAMHNGDAIGIKTDQAIIPNMYWRIK